MTEGTTEVSKGLRTRAGLLMQLAQIAEGLADAQDSMAQLEDRKEAILKALGQDSGGVILPPPIVAEDHRAPTTTVEDPSRESLFRADIRSMASNGTKFRASEVFDRLQKKYAAVEPRKIRSQAGFLLTRMVRRGELIRLNRGVYRQVGADRRPLGARAGDLLAWIRVRAQPVTYSDILDWFKAHQNSGKSSPAALAGNACTTLVRRGDLQRLERGLYRATA